MLPAPNNWRVRWKLSLVIGLAVLSVSVTIALFSYTVSLRQMNRDMNSYMGRFVHQLVVQFDSYFQDIDKLSTTIWLNQEVISYITNPSPNVRADWQIRYSIANQLSRQMYSREGISGIFLVLADGTVIADTNQNIVYEADDFPQLEDASRRARSIYSERRGHYRNYVLSYFRTLRDLQDGRLLGHLVIDVRLAEIESLISKSSMEGEPSGYIEIVDARGRIVYHPDRAKIGEPAEERPVSDAEPSRIRREGRDDFRVASNSPFTEWQVVWMAPAGELLKGIDFVRNMTILIGLLATTLSMLIAIRFSCDMTKPLEKLQEAMRRAEKGDLHAAAPVYYRDEIGQVAKTFNKMLDQIRRLTAENVQTESIRNQALLQEKQARLNSLRAQINPHFLYNTLDSLMGMSVVGKQEELRHGLGALSRMFRYSLSSPRLVSLAEEISHVRDFFTIIELRFDELYQLSVDVPEPLRTLRVCPLILQPLVENSVKHGLEPAGRPGVVTIRARRIGGLLSLVVEDNGAGISPERLGRVRDALEAQWPSDERPNIGLYNVHMRLKLVYGDRARLTIDSQPGSGTRIHLLLPIAEKNPPIA